MIIDGRLSGILHCLLPMEQAVNAALDQAFRGAEHVLLARLGSITSAALACDFHHRLTASGRPFWNCPLPLDVTFISGNFAGRSAALVLYK